VGLGRGRPEQQQLPKMSWAQGGGKSALAEHLLKQWAWGHFSPQQVQCIANLALQDFGSGAPLEDLRTCASIGSSGQHPNNMHRDLVAKFAPNMFETQEICLPLKARSTPGFRMSWQKVMWPHEVFSVLYNNYKHSWQETISPGDDALESFWAQVQEHPQMHNHPVKQRAGYERRCIPLTLHGDGVPVTGIGKSWSKSMELFSWTSCLGVGTTVALHYLIWGCWLSHMSEGFGKNTMSGFWKALTWSFFWLWRGVFPDRDASGNVYARRSEEGRKAGTPLAGGYYAVLWVIRGDLDWFFKSLHLNHFNSLKPCCLCKADTKGTPWTDFRKQSAKWLKTIWKAAPWSAAEDRHVLFSLPGVSILTVAPDLLHVKHLGSDTYFYASVLEVLVCKTLPGTPEQNLDKVWDEVLSYYKTNKITGGFSAMKLSMFWRQDNHPKMKGKAAEIRRLGPALLHVCQAKMQSGQLQEQQIKLALKFSSRLEEILDEHPRGVVLPHDAAVEYEDATFKFLALQTALANGSMAAGQRSFNVTIKSHYLVHIALLSRFVHPRLSWNYSGEDFMQKIKHLAASCVKGNHPHDAFNKVATKYSLAMDLQMSRAR
jgi:hypothetical protein